MHYKVLLPVLVAIASAAPSIITFQDVSDSATRYMKAAEANGCNWYSE